MKLQSVGILFAVCSTSWATIAYDNLTGDPPYVVDGGWTVSGNTGAAVYAYREALRFTSGASGMLNDITIALSHDQGNNNYFVSLFADDQNEVGDLLVQFPIAISAKFKEVFTPVTLTNVLTDPGLHPELVLKAGTAYWLEAMPASLTSDTYGVWNYSTAGDTGIRRLGIGVPEVWWYLEGSKMGAFRVTVDPASVPVPEPATIALAGLALAAAARRRKKASV